MKTKVQNNRRTFSFEQIRKAAILYMALPLLCFFCGFLRWYYAIICSAALCLVVRLTWKSDNILKPDEKSSFAVSVKAIILVFLASMLWTYLAGINGYFYQTSDWDCRNAVYFDLIQYDWPVRYDLNGGALVYYIGLWLPPAALAKIFLLISGSLKIALFMGRMFLWVWTSIAITIIILMIWRVLNAQTRGKRIISILLFAFFSGLDLLGAICRNRLDFLLEPNWHLHLEWWLPGFQYTSVMACLFWVFNQAVIPWMITLCFLTEEDPRNYVYYCVVCTLCGTLPCVGLVVLMSAKAMIFVVRKLKNREGRKIFGRFFSVQNLLSFLILFPAIAMFVLSANTAQQLLPKKAEKTEELPAVAIVEEVSQMTAAEETQQTDQVDPEAAEVSQETENKAETENILSTEYISKYLLIFLLFEVAAYMLLIWADHWKNPLFYVIGICFVVIPYIHVGKAYDFCMRASIPGLFILMIYVSRFLFAHFPRKENKAEKPFRKVLAVLLALCFAVGMATPVIEIYRGIYHVIDEGTIRLENRKIMTFNQEHIYNNFLCSNPDDQFFFQYLARQ